MLNVFNVQGPPGPQGERGDAGPVGEAVSENFVVRSTLIMRITLWTVY